MSLTLVLVNGSASTDYHPSDGRGSSTSTAADSLVVDARTSRLIALQASGDVTVYHGADKVTGSGIAAFLDASAYTTLDCGLSGIELLGNWYVQCAAGTNMTLVFEAN